LHGNAIRCIEGLDGLGQLRVLVLCFNEIARIEGLDQLHQLERLELGFNLIKRIEGLKGLTRLRSLELNNNLIYRLDDVAVLAKHVPDLQELTLRNNAVCEVKSYRPQLLAQLPCLTSLDGIRIEDARDHGHAHDMVAAITPSLIRAHAYSRKRYSYSLRPNSIAENSMTPGSPKSEGGLGGSSGASGLGGLDDAGEEGLDSDQWWWAVEELELNHQHLRKLHGLERLVNLRRASFCDNELGKIEGLERCAALEELSLEDNRIAKLENLNALRRLTKLDLGKNRITHVEGLEGLALLSQLSLEDNDIASLSPLAKLGSLMELYIGNNRLVALKEVQQLKELPKLIILDLSGNPLCETDEYRQYTVYQLRKLKVLDGVGIESNEQLSAKERFAGRLTADALLERLGHQFWQHVRELDLSRSKLRELDALHAEGFCNLRELNLDGNLIAALDTLPRLSALTVLRLNNNLITTLPPTPADSGRAGGVGARGAVSSVRIIGGDGDGSGGDGAASGLCSMCSLEVLQLGFNQITDLSALKLHALPHLKILHLQGNEISRVEGLDSLQHLRELVLDRNKIKGLDPDSLASLCSLRELRMEEVGLRSLAHFGPLPLLHALYLGGNRIAELVEIDRIAHLPALVDLVLANNPCARKPLYRPTTLRKLLPLRTLDSREIGPEERERADLLLTTDRPSVPQQQVDRLTGGKVPLKLTSLNFELMSGLQGGGAGAEALGAGLPHGGASGACSAPHSAGPLGLGAGAGAPARIGVARAVLGARVLGARDLGRPGLGMGP